MATRRLTMKTDLRAMGKAATPMVFTIEEVFPQELGHPERKAPVVRNISDLLLLGASTGSVIEVAAGGKDEELAVAAITSLVIEAFGSDMEN